MNRLRRWQLLLGLLFSAFATQVWANEDESPAPPALSLWDRSFNLRAGAGYRDNVLLSPVSARDSAFFKSEFEALVYRLPDGDHQFFFFGAWEDLRYLKNVPVHKEQSGIALAKWERNLGPFWNTGISFQYFYQDQLFDVSATEAQLSVVQLQGHGLKGAWFLTRMLSETLRLNLEIPAVRQFLRAPLDHYWEGGPKLTLEWRYGHRSTLSGGYRYLRRAYDTRPEASPLGLPIPGTQLQFNQHEWHLAQRHHWDARRRWRTETRAALEWNQDCGSGYFDYLRYSATQQLRYAQPLWNVQAQARLSFYDYQVQRAAPNTNARRYFTTLAASLRAERLIIKSLKAFGEFNHERVLSNRALTEYTANTVLGGLDLEF